MKKYFDYYTGYIQTDIFLTAAKLKGWSVEVLLKDEYALGEIRKGNLRYRAYKDNLSFNNNISTKISSNKYLTHLILKTCIPEYTTQAQVFEIKNIPDETLLKLLEKHKKLVVKPLSENNGVGISTALTDLDAVKKAIEKVSLLRNSQVLIENHVETTHEYRIIIWKGKAIDALRRIPAFVVGDGTSTVRMLIEQKNQKRYELFENIFEPIVIDDDVFQLLKINDLTLDSVLPADFHLTIKNTCNLSTGGEVERIALSDIHKDYHDIFQKMYDATWMNYCGMDLITSDITQPPQPGKTAINELNGGPGITLGFYDDLMTNRPFYGAFQILDKAESDPVDLF